jgi:hypothetical protein
MSRSGTFSWMEGQWAGYEADARSQRMVAFLGVTGPSFVSAMFHFIS